MNYAINLYNPNNDSKAKEPFSVSIQSSIFDDVDELFSPACRTFSSEEANVFLERKMTPDKIYRKTFQMQLEGEGGKSIGGISLSLYNIPHLIQNGMNMSALMIHDVSSDPMLLLENSLLLSITNENGMPDEKIISLERPCLFLRAIQIEREERKKGYGSYLFHNYENLLRGCFGIDYGAVLTMNCTFLTQKDSDIAEKGVAEYYENQQGIIRKWLDKGGFQKYADGENGSGFFRKIS